MQPCHQTFSLYCSQHVCSGDVTTCVLSKQQHHMQQSCYQMAQENVLNILTRVRRSYVLLLFFSIINVIIFCRTSNLQSLSKVCWANQKKLTQTYCSSLRNFYGLKSAKFGFNFRLHSPLSRPNFEIERRII